MELLDYGQRPALGNRCTVDVESGVASRNPHTESILDLTKIRIERSAQIGQPEIVRWRRDEDGGLGHGLAAPRCTWRGPRRGLRTTGRGRAAIIGAGAGGPRRGRIIR